MPILTPPCQPWVAPVILLLFLFAVLPLCFLQVKGHRAALSTLTTPWAWYSIFIAMVISSAVCTVAIPVY